MPDDKPKVSLGIPLYNESEFLEETIISLLNQTYKDIEIIAIDNNSSDGSFKILERISIIGAAPLIIPTKTVGL